MADETFAYWCVVEQFGHRRLAGYLTEQTIAGGGYLRLDVPEVEGHPASTHLLAHSSIYALHPVDEATARAVAKSCRPAPVQRYELPAAPTGLERDLDRLAEAVDGVTCDHDPRTVPDPNCAGCIARSVLALVNRHGIGDDEDDELVTNLRDDDEEPF